MKIGVNWLKYTDSYHRQLLQKLRRTRKFRLKIKWKQIFAQLLRELATW